MLEARHLITLMVACQNMKQPITLWDSELVFIMQIRMCKFTLKEVYYGWGKWQFEIKSLRIRNTFMQSHHGSNISLLTHHHVCNSFNNKRNSWDILLEIDWRWNSLWLKINPIQLMPWSRDMISWYYYFAIINTS